MNKLTPYLALLVQLREDLAANLTYMGVSADADEPLKTLIPKVLQISQGDPSQELWSAEMQPLSPSYGFFSTGETASLANICEIALCNRVASATVAIKGTGVAALRVTAPGWGLSQETDALTLTRDIDCRAALERALAQITVAGDDSTEVAAQITVSVTFQSGATAAASGSCALKFAYATTWGLLENAYGYTWGELESAEMTWGQLAQLGKPEDV